MLFQGGLTMRYFRFCILAVISCSMAVAARAQQQWIEIKSQHFSVLTDADESQGREIATYFEQMRSVFGHLLLKDAAPRSATVRIIAFLDRSRINNFGLLMDQSVPTASRVLDSVDVVEDLDQGSVGLNGGIVVTSLRVKEIYLHSPEEDYVLLNLLVKRNWTTVFHEYAHRLLESNFPALPRWFSEGFAEYYSAVKIEKKHVRLGLEPALASSVLAHKDWTPISTLFSYTAANDDRGKNPGFYAESWLVFDYLANNQKLEQAQNDFQLVRQNITIPEAIQQARKMTHEELDRHIRNYSQQRKKEKPHTLSALE